MVLLLVTVAAGLLLVLVFAGTGFQKYYRKYRLYRARLERLEQAIAPRSPLFPTVGADWLGQCFQENESGFPGGAAVRILGASASDYRQCREREQWLVGGLALAGGTLIALADDHGCSAWLLAANAPATARVIQVALPGVAPCRQAMGEQVRTLAPEALPPRSATTVVVDLPPGREDFEHWVEHALQLARPGGSVLWRGWGGAGHPLGGRLHEALARLAPRHRLVHIAATSFVACQLPGEGAP